MPIISFAKKRAPVEAPLGLSLMQGLLAGSVPVASSCGGDGVCGRCRIRVVAGAENLASPTEQEELLAEKYGLASDERISCQAKVRGNVVVDAAYW
jgi:2Fe-2S ferredoxin